MNKESIKNFESRVKKTIEDYKLLNKKDRVIVACSGGKDSTTVLYLLNKFGYNAEGLIIDLKIGEWSKKNLENITKFCKNHKIRLHIVDLRNEFGCSICYIRSIIKSKKELNNCTICGVIKRWLLNKKARDLNATKIATGHNLDDEAETVLMNFLRGNPRLSLGLGPKTGVIDSNKFVPRIKPLYFSLNKDAIDYSKAMKFPILYEKCPCSVDSYRRKLRGYLNELEKDNPNLKINIVNSFLRIKPALKEFHKTKEKLRYCEICGGASRNKICRNCELINIIRH